MKIGGVAQNDSAGFVSQTDTETELGSLEGGVEWRRARLYAELTLADYFDFKFMYDFARGNPPNLQDAYVDFSRLPIPFQIRGGRFKNPLGIELATGAKYLTFLERGLISAFLQNRNTGAYIHGDSPRRRMKWTFGVLKQEDDFGIGSTDRVGLSARFAVAPQPWNDHRLVHLGVDYTRRPVEETVRFLERPESNIAPQFVDTGDMQAEDVNTGILEGAYVDGPFSLQGEFAYTTVESSEMSSPEFYAFYVFGSYFLTGETRPYKVSNGAFGRLHPKREFRDGAGGRGAFEVAFRFSRIDLDDKDIQGGRLNDLTAAFNWYATKSYRVMTNVIWAKRSDFDPVWIFQIRLQVGF
jgi:phosphate-selective porin OprO/OprP